MYLVKEFRKRESLLTLEEATEKAIEDAQTEAYDKWVDGYMVVKVEAVYIPELPDVPVNKITADDILKLTTEKEITKEIT